MLKTVGVNVDLRSNDTPVLYARLRVRDLEMAVTAWLQVPDPEFYTYLLLTSSVEGLTRGYSNPAFDAKSRGGGSHHRYAQGAWRCFARSSRWVSTTTPSCRFTAR